MALSVLDAAAPACRVLLRACCVLAAADWLAGWLAGWLPTVCAYLPTSELISTTARSSNRAPVTIRIRVFGSTVNERTPAHAGPGLRAHPSRRAGQRADPPGGRRTHAGRGPDKGRTRAANPRPSARHCVPCVPCVRGRPPATVELPVKSPGRVNYGSLGRHRPRVTPPASSRPLRPASGR